MEGRGGGSLLVNIHSGSLFRISKACSKSQPRSLINQKVHAPPPPFRYYFKVPMWPELIACDITVETVKRRASSCYDAAPKKLCFKSYRPGKTAIVLGYVRALAPLITICLHWHEGEACVCVCASVCHCVSAQRSQRTLAYSHTCT